ncbi:MAG: hypothetical protein LR011_05875 [Verrucomicrobia bacterium]|nr:hypothetical protein [Verrucomicrobiota bacterium]
MSHPWKQATWIIVAVTAVSALIWISSLPKRDQPVAPLVPIGEAQNSVSAPIQSQVVHTNSPISIEREPFHWSQIESTNYLTYVQNLREIGCPEETIKNIVTGEMNQLFRSRLRQEVGKLDLTWWEAQPRFSNESEIRESIRSLNQERITILTTILPESEQDWESWTVDSSSWVALGPEIWGRLSSDQIDKLDQFISSLLKPSNRPKSGWHGPDALDHAGSQIQLTSAQILELSSILEPVDPVEFLLRYSPTAGNLRQKIGALNLSPDVFRSIFLQWDQWAQRGISPTSQQMDQLLKIHLTPEQSSIWSAMDSPGFKRTLSLLDRAGIGRSQATTINEIEIVADSEILAIQNDPNLSDPERSQHSDWVHQQKSEALKSILSDEQLRSYQMWKAYESTRARLDPAPDP